MATANTVKDMCETRSNADLRAWGVRVDAGNDEENNNPKDPKT